MIGILDTYFVYCITLKVILHNSSNDFEYNKIDDVPQDKMSQCISQYFRHLHVTTYNAQIFFIFYVKRRFLNLCLDKSSISWHRDVYFYLKDDSVHFLNNFVCILIHVWGNVTKICLLFEQYYPSIQTKRKITIKITSFFVTRSQSSNMNSKLIFFNPSSKCGNSKTKDSLNTGFNVRFLT